MSNPKKKPLAINMSTNQKYWQVLKQFKRKGFKHVTSLASVGHTASVSHRRYKGVKTLLIETKEYSQLQSLYKNAIKNYNAKKIQSIKTTLPKVLISTYYSKYKKHAKTRAQLLQLKTIAHKLDLDAPKVPQEKKKEPEKPVKKIQTIKKATTNKVVIPKKSVDVIVEQKETRQKEITKKSLPKPQPSSKPYEYYLKNARLSELSEYIADKKTKNTLSYNQYYKLTRRKSKLEERRLVKYGSLEELIAAYKVNKKEKYKRRIMTLMKAKQTQN